MNGILQRHGGEGLLNIRACMDQDELDALAVAFSCLFERFLQRSVGLGPVWPPKRDRTELLPTTALDQSILSANPNLPRSAFQTFLASPEGAASRSSRCRNPTPEPWFPCRCVSCNEQDSRQSQSVGNTGTTTLGIRVDWWMERPRSSPIAHLPKGDAPTSVLLEPMRIILDWQCRFLLFEPLQHLWPSVEHHGNRI